MPEILTKEREKKLVEYKKESPTAQKIAVKQRDLNMLQARQHGASLQEIGEAWNISFQAVQQALSRLLKKHEVEGVAEYRELELQRLDALFALNYSSALEGKNQKAFTNCITLMRERAKLLGLYQSFNVSIGYNYSEQRIEVLPVAVDYRKQLAPLAPKGTIIEGEVNEQSPTTTNT